MRSLACGTEEGYQAHVEVLDPPCAPCRDARALHRVLIRAIPGPEQPTRYRAALEGSTPAEVLTTEDRGRLVGELYAHGWSDVQIAAHTRMTTYTTTRIRGALGLAPIITSAREGAA